MAVEELPSWIWAQTGGEAAPAQNSTFPLLILSRFQPHLKGKSTPGVVCADLWRIWALLGVLTGTLKVTTEPRFLSHLSWWCLWTGE